MWGILSKLGLGVGLTAKVRRSLAMAVRNLWLHKLRSFLSVLGIIIGTGAVIALMAFGEGSMHDALEAIKKQGATNIIVMSVKPPEGATSTSRAWVATYGLTRDDFRRFEQTLPDVIATLPIRAFEAEIRPVTEPRSCTGRLVATTSRYATVNKLEASLPQGHRFITPKDEHELANVAVLGSEVAQEIFPGENPLGKSIKIGGKDQALTVIGVLKRRAPNTSSGKIEQYDKDIYVPLTTLRERFGEISYTRSAGSRSAEKVQYSMIILTVREDGDIDQVRDCVRNTARIVAEQLRTSHGIDKNDWDIRVPLDKLEDAERVRDERLRDMLVIACISLAVGGIGIMNIMLATVTERIREIGIRRALGAKRGDITLQFLLEAIVQTTVGGVLGIAAGLGVAFGFPKLAAVMWQGHYPSLLHVPSIFIAFSFAVAVGVVFGLYPAYRAAHLDPIEALRHE